MVDYQNIIINKKEKLAYVTINRPDVLNALNQETVNEIGSALTELENDDDVQCLIFTGSGEKAFVAGADIAQLNKKTMLDALSATDVQKLFDRIEACQKPTIAMINGFALGGGCELAMSCDIRIASTNAKLGLPELNLSIIPGAGGTQRLARLVGKGKALEMILTGKMVKADEAKAIGLVSEVVEPDQLMAETEKLAETILSKGPLAVMFAKLSVNLGTETDLKTGLAIEKLSQAILFATEDKKEGTSAFLEKRKPNFKRK